MHRPHLKFPTLSRKTLIISGVVVLICVVGASTFALTRPAPVANQTHQTDGQPVKKSEPKLAQESQTPAESTEQQTEPTPQAQRNNTPAPAQPRSSTPLPTPQPRPFRVNYIYFDQAAAFCVGPNMENVRIHDARLLLTNTDGGQITYEFTVTGIPNPSPGPRTLNVPAGVSTTSIRELQGSVAPASILETIAYAPHPPIHIQLNVNGIVAGYGVSARALGECQ